MLRDCRWAARDKAPALQDTQLLVVAVDTMVEGRSQGVEASAHQNDSIERDFHRDLLRREESAYSDVEPGRTRPRKDPARALPHSLV